MVEVDVLVDGSGRVGALSYLAAADLGLAVGDGVVVPFGRSVRPGLVVDVRAELSGRATRQVLSFVQRRAGVREVELARHLAARHLVPVEQTLRLLHPSRHLDAAPAAVAELVRHGPDVPLGSVPEGRRWLLVRAPLADPSALAAQEAERIHRERGGQVLVLCPTVALVSAVLALLPEGAVRLDARAPSGAWAAFAGGSAAVGVGTRAAALYSARRLAGLVVVDEEQEGHSASSQPYLNARDVAIERSSRSRCSLTLISSCPSPQAVGARVRLARAGGVDGWPKMQVIDRLQLPPSQRLVPPRVASLVSKELAAGRSPVVLAERSRTTLRCARCRAAWPCAQPGCSPSSCAHPPSGPCPACSGRVRVPAGFDAERVSALLPGVRPVSLAELSRLRGAGLVVVFDISPALRAAEWVPGARAARLLTAAAAAAGPSGRVVVCSWEKPSAVVELLCRESDQLAVARLLWEHARTASLPPFGTLVSVTTRRARPPSTSGWPGRVFGPRRTASGEWELVVHLPGRDTAPLEVPLARLRRGGKVRVKLL